MMPFTILGMWFKGLLAIAILIGGGYLLYDWYERAHVWQKLEVVEDAGRIADSPKLEAVREGDAQPRQRVFEPDLGFNRGTAELAAGILLLTLAILGLPLTNAVDMLRLKAGTDEPKATRDGVVKTLQRPDGSTIHVELYGRSDAPAIVMTHGWGANATEWYYEKERLTEKFQLIVWDLPGLGLSKKPDNNDFSLEKYARDLDAVIALAGDRPVVILGHSIGGMISLTFCRLFPQALGSRVAGMVLIHTSYTNPVRTTKHAWLYSALEKPLIVPLLHLTIATWPFVWLMNWMNYFNGSAHRSTGRESFAGTETRGQLDFAARFMPQGRPDVLARGMFGMLHYDATEVLPSIPIPTLVVVGDRDVTTLPEAGEFIASRIPHARLEKLAPGRHMGLIEKNEDYDRLLREFAGSVLAPHTVS
jgi:pimeloyl-ACP methyl ester carboxylesterase